MLYCSIALYITSKQGAEELTRRKYLGINGEVAYTKTYESMSNPRRCFNCHKFDDHLTEIDRMDNTRLILADFRCSSLPEVGFV